jgi:phage tail sheath gpL-like
VQVVALQRADPPSKESYQLSIRFIISELILNGKQVREPNTKGSGGGSSSSSSSSSRVQEEDSVTQYLMNSTNDEDPCYVIFTILL